MRTRGRPLYLVIFDNKITLPHLQNTVKYVLSTKINWEKRRSERRITQCRRCQLWGHSSVNCARLPRCMKCAEAHLTTECIKSPNVPARCCNCQGQHPASSIQCPTYIARITALDKAQQPQQPKTQYQPAPPPTTNAWTSRQQRQSGPVTTNTGVQSQTRPAPHVTVEQRATAANQAAPSQQASVPQLHATRNVVQTATETSSLLRDLSKEFDILNSLTDLQQMLLAVRELNSLLGSATDSLSRLQALNTFVTNILPQYNI